MNILFLDIDGVLKTFETYYPKQGFNHKFEKSCVAYLNKALKNSDIQIIICSMWRLDFDDPLESIRQVFKYNNIEYKITGLTPIIAGFNKGKEIMAWMNNNPEAYNYLVVDDDAVKADFFRGIPLKNKIAPNPDLGLTELECNQIINFFTK